MTRRYGRSTRNSYDYIVVGAGSAGCVVASRLSENPNTDVLLVEAGPRDYSLSLQIPAARIWMNPRYDWAYPALPDPSRFGRYEEWESGKVLGGSSSINGMLWVRGSPSDYDTWATLGCPGWDYASVLPYFRRGETFEGGGNQYRGDRGPQRVSYVHVHHPLTDDFVSAALHCGRRVNSDYNGERPDGVAFGQVSQRRGLRHSAARAYLGPARFRRNLKIVSSAFVNKILFSGTSAIGIEYSHRAEVTRAYCTNEVILSAGAIGSPRLLLLSGVGPQAEMKKQEIAPIADVPGVGKNLQNHLYVSLIHEVDVPTLNRDLTPGNIVRHGVDLILRGRGAATSALGHAMVFGSLGDAAVDFQGIFGPYAIMSEKQNGRARAPSGSSTKINGVTCRVGLMRPDARGTISLASADPSDPPVIAYQSASEPSDVRKMVKACRQMREILYTAPIVRHIIDEVAPGSDVVGDREWTNFIRRVGIVGKHAAGSCKMGSDDAAVVDPELNVYGVQSLRVIDLSVTPVIVSGNTNAAAMMIGEYGAAIVNRGNRALSGIGRD